VKAAAVVAEILKREGVQFLIGYPVDPIIEAAAEADIRTIIVRQERTGLHMADAVSRVTSGKRIGVFAMQHGPGAENSFGGVAHGPAAYDEGALFPAWQSDAEIAPTLVCLVADVCHARGAPPDGCRRSKVDHATPPCDAVPPPGTQEIEDTCRAQWRHPLTHLHVTARFRIDEVG
jgi:hypothetical protein